MTPEEQETAWQTFDAIDEIKHAQELIESVMRKLRGEE